MLGQTSFKIVSLFFAHFNSCYDFDLSDLSQKSLGILFFLDTANSYEKLRTLH